MVDGVHRVWLHFQRARVGCAVVCKYRQGSATLSPFHLCQKKKSCFSQCEGPLDHTFDSVSKMSN